jgi:hypothetical protein
MRCRKGFIPPSIAEGSLDRVRRVLLLIAMDVRVLTYGYNERELLPLKLAWCEHHGVRLVYFDNESTDGSREWAIENGVFAGDLLTGGAFDIDAIIREVDRYRRSSHYDWTVLAGVDLFLSGLGEHRLLDYLARRSELEPQVDGISGYYAMLCRVEDEGPEDLTQYSQYCIRRDDLVLIARSGVEIQVDHLACANHRNDEHLWWFNFGHTKSREQRRETYERRKLAWDRGLNRDYGSHYRALASTDFTTPAESAMCIHESPASAAFTALVGLLRELGRSP